MIVLKYINIALVVLTSLALIVVVLLQSGKESGLGSITGKNETYLGKSKFGTLDKVLASATKWIVLAWAVLTLTLHLFP
ncbi:MAG: preprotein translocase subunit SecG [Oscillospiraceae bacterium]|nr:preprotein translocase subunit SecG [Oscillospiraceae bacterium]MBQ9929481.1 preprotein translocase subunit SecG [Oscillospiraceae bacterium]